MQVYSRVPALIVTLAREVSIVFRVLMKLVYSLTTYSQVISITCECTESLNTFFAWEYFTSGKQAMQANPVKSLCLAFCYSNLFLWSSMNNHYSCIKFILFNALCCALIRVFIDQMYALLVRHSTKLTVMKVNYIHTFVN